MSKNVVAKAENRFLRRSRRLWISPEEERRRRDLCREQVPRIQSATAQVLALKLSWGDTCLEVQERADRAKTAESALVHVYKGMLVQENQNQVSRGARLSYWKLATWIWMAGLVAGSPGRNTFCATWWRMSAPYPFAMAVDGSLL